MNQVPAQTQSEHNALGACKPAPRAGLRGQATVRARSQACQGLLQLQSAMERWAEMPLDEESSRTAQGSATQLCVETVSSRQVLRELWTHLPEDRNRMKDPQIR